MPEIPQFRGLKRRGGLLCRVRVTSGEHIWRGVTRIVTVEGFCIEVHGGPPLTFGEGDTVSVQVDSAALGQMTTVAKITAIAVYNRGGSGTSVLIEVEPPTRLDNVSFRAFRERMAALKPLILSVGAGDRLRETDYPGFRLDEAITLSEAARLLENDQVAVVVFGPTAKPMEIRSLLRKQAEDASRGSVHVVLYEETPPSAFQDLVDDDAIFYLTHASIAAPELRSTIAAAVRHYLQQQEVSPMPPELMREAYGRLTDLRLTLTSTSNLPGLSRVLSEELSDFLNATQARCLLYDPETDTLSAGGAEISEQEPLSASAGLVGYVARTRECVRIELVSKDPRYDSEADNPGGTVEAHFIAHPLSGAGGTTIGVLTATREANLSPFTALDEGRIEALAVRAAPLLHVLLADQRTRQSDVMSDNIEQNLFRKEALDHQGYPKSEGHLLWGVPFWLTWSHLLIVLFLAIGIAYALMAKVHQIASGPAVILITNKISVLALNTGVVATLKVMPGDRVTEGELLATLQGTPGDSLLLRMREEIRAPSDGLISDVDVHTGQAVTAGEQVLSLADKRSKLEVLALLPGSYAPQVHPGMGLTLKIDGYPQSREEVTILEVAPDIFGPSDAARYIGKEIAQTLSLTGPILMVRAELSKDTFESASDRFHYHDGMVARAEVSVRKEPLITALVPGIKRLYNDPRISLGRATDTGTADRGKP